MSAEADASEWNRLLVLTTIIDTIHAMKCVCLDANPQFSPYVTFFCMTVDGIPLGEDTFRCEQNMERVFDKFNESDAHHKVMCVIFQEEEDATIPAIIIGMKDPGETITKENLARTQASCSSGRL